MKYFRILILSLMISILSGFTFGYQQYGFSEYNEKAGKVSFSCSNQCYITLGEKDNIDYLNIKGSVNGNGDLAYGFTMGEQVALINQQKVFLQTQVNESINFVDYTQYFSSIPGNANLILMINGNINGELNIDANIFSIGEKIGQGRKDFRKMETFTPYSINLRYGVSLNGKSIVRQGYIIFVLAAILIIIFKKGNKDQKFKTIFFVGLGIFLFIGMRNTITYTSILDQGLKGFNKDKTYFDLGDYILFTENVRTKLDLDTTNMTKDDCKIYIESFQEWPFSFHREFFYLKPCERVMTGDLANYKIYYKTEIPSQDSNKKVLINSNGSVLLKNN